MLLNITRYEQCHVAGAERGAFAGKAARKSLLKTIVKLVVVANALLLQQANSFAPQQAPIRIPDVRLLNMGAGSSSPFNRDHSLTNPQDSSKSADIRQLLGMPEAAEANDLWKIRLQLTKPITWVPLSLGVMCGAAASGNYHWMWNPFDPLNANVLMGLEDAIKGFAAMVLAGPFMEGFSQTLNDWYDRDVDAINEPYRPIPRGAISEQEVLWQIWVLLLGGLGLAHVLDIWAGNNSFPWVLSNALIGSIISYMYSAPPFRLKQNGWSGDAAIGFCYIALPWWCGQSVFGPLDKAVYWILPLVYSIAGMGPAIVNDFKSVEGDKRFGLQSFPVMYGVDRAKWICAAFQTLPQLGVAVYLWSIGESTYAAALLCLLVPQLYFQATLLLPDPIENDMKYQAATQPFLFFGLLVAALCVGHHDWPIAAV